LLESLGHRVEEVTPPWSDQDLLPDFTRLFAPMVSMQTAIGAQLRGREPTEDDVEPLTWSLWEHAKDTDSVTFLTSLTRMQSVGRALVAFMDAFDVVLTPTLAQRPARIGEIHGLGPDPWGHFQRSSYFTPYTAMGNVTGLPAISLPLYQGEDGLPLPVHLIGRPLAEGQLLSLATQLEAALPWADRLPQLASPSRA
jgi:amidase